MHCNSYDQLQTQTESLRLPLMWKKTQTSRLKPIPWRRDLLHTVMESSHWQCCFESKLRHGPGEKEPLRSTKTNQNPCIPINSETNFAASIWDPNTKKNITKLQKVQRSAAHFVCSDYSPFSSVSSMLDKLQWQTLEDRREAARLTNLFKIRNGEQLVIVTAA